VASQKSINGRFSHRSSSLPIEPPIPSTVNSTVTSVIVKIALRRVAATSHHIIHTHMQSVSGYEYETTRANVPGMVLIWDVSPSTIAIRKSKLMYNCIGQVIAAAAAAAAVCVRVSE
jgi:hypothetical protein